MGRVPEFIKRAPRVDIRRPAVLINSHGIATDVVILDVSGSGFKLEVHESPGIGEVVTLRVPKSDDIQAQIRWALGDQAGGVFLTPVDLDLS